MSHGIRASIFVGLDWDCRFSTPDPKSNQSTTCRYGWLKRNNAQLKLTKNLVLLTAFSWNSVAIVASQIHVIPSIRSARILVSTVPI